MYCPRVRQSTPASRSSVTWTQHRCQKTAGGNFSVCVCVWDLQLHTPHSVAYLFVGLPKSQHDGGLGEDAGLDLLSMFEDTQRLVEVCSGVTNVPGNRSWADKREVKKKGTSLTTLLLLQFNQLWEWSAASCWSECATALISESELWHD